MGAPWTTHIRIFHLTIVLLVTITCLVYLAYTSSYALSESSSLQSLERWSQPFHQLNATENIIQYNIKHIQLSSSASPKQLITVDSNNNSQKLKSNCSKVTACKTNGTSDKNNVLDLSKGVPAAYIYEAGHTNPSVTICPNLGVNLTLLVIITSAPHHEDARNAIRNTWGSITTRSDVSIGFMLGTNTNETLNLNLQREQFLYRDIIVGKFIDTYDNLTLKTISLLEWVDTYCPKSQFVLKTDDDMFINVRRLLDSIAKKIVTNCCIYGRLAKKWKPIRKVKSKYYVSYHQYPHTYFPNFTTGPAYLLPTRIVNSLYRACLIHMYLRLEDVFVTGIVAEDLRIERHSIPAFYNQRIVLTLCEVRRLISIHKVKREEQYDAWKKLNDNTLNTKCKR